MRRCALAAIVLLSMPVFGAEGLLGYYRHPAIHDETIVFYAESDLWRIPAMGGTARRLTTHLERERFPCISPNGKTVAFTASYDGTHEIYLMPLEGGLPTRITHEGISGRRGPRPVSWKSDSELVYATWYFATRDAHQLAILNVETGKKEIIPLEQASDGDFSDDGKTLFFTRLPRQNSFAKRYRGGLIENLWRFREGDEEAVPLTPDYDGTSRDPMVWKDRLYFSSDRDGTMNLWSITLEGKDPVQHTSFAGWDLLSPSLHNGRIIFGNRADIWIYDIAQNKSRKVDIRLASDFDQKRERWISNPMTYLKSWFLSHDGKRVGLTIRGSGYVLPVKAGRVIRLRQNSKSRTRDLRFLPGSEDVIYLSDRSGEMEFWREPANGLGEPSPITSGGKTMRHDGIPSPDGKLLAHTDRNQVLWMRNLVSGDEWEVARSGEGNEWDYIDLSWSPDSRWIAYSDTMGNQAKRVFLYDAQDRNAPVAVTSARLDSYSPVFGAEGKWLYFLSDRTFRSVQGSPWGARQPEPLLDKTAGIYALDLQGGQRSPFAGPNEGELPLSESEGEEKKEINLENLDGRLFVLPVEPSNYRYLTRARGNLYCLFSSLSLSRKSSLVSFPITSDSTRHKWTTIMTEVRGYEISGDGTTCLVRKGDSFYVFPATGKAPSSSTQGKLSLSGLSLSVSPAEEWGQMFRDAWRMHRDYFYDPKMHRVDWNEMGRRHEALLPRLTTRWELDHLISQMVGELSAMHTDIYAGDIRDATDGASLGHLGAQLLKVEEGFRIDRLYETDPDYPGEVGPLLKAGVEMKVGDVILSVDGEPATRAPEIGSLLKNKAGQKVLLESRRIGIGGTRKSIVTPLSSSGFRNLKTSHWEYTRRLEAEAKGKGEIGYFHMRGMSASNYAEFVKGYYPVFNRKGLIIDMRQNYGGNIDSWILSRLSRKPWMYWKTRTGRPFANMQFAFDGHMAVLVDAYTISDGEAFSEGFRRLGLGPLIGTKTWGGGIWLRGATRLMDGGMARSPETGVYAPERTWIIEGTGVTPDMVVDNLPHESFGGRDAQLEAALTYLQTRIKEDPPSRPEPPARPDKSFRYPAGP